MWRIPQKITDFVTFTEEILNGKLRFLCSELEYFWFHEVYSEIQNLALNRMLSGFRDATVSRNV